MKLTKLEERLLAGATKALSVAEANIHDALDGTKGLERALAELDPVREAIAAAMARKARKAPRRKPRA